MINHVQLVGRAEQSRAASAQLLDSAGLNNCQPSLPHRQSVIDMYQNGWCFIVSLGTQSAHSSTGQPGPIIQPRGEALVTSGGVESVASGGDDVQFCEGGGSP